MFVRRNPDGECTLRFVWANHPRVYEFNATEDTVTVLRNFTGDSSLEMIALRLSLDSRHLLPIIGRLLQKGILMDRDTVHLGSATLSRQDFFFLSFGLSEQDAMCCSKALTQAHIAILGLGGVGSTVAEGLARLGVGSITLIDPDRVESSNLQRQSLFSLSHVGRFKAECAAERISEINSSVVTQPVVAMILSDRNMEGALASVPSVIVNAADEPDADMTNAVVTAYSFKNQVPHLLASGYDGHLCSIGQTVIPWKTSCWGCRERQIQRNPDLAGFVHYPIGQCQMEGGTIGAVASIIGGIQVLEVAKLVSGMIRPGFAGRFGNIDFKSYKISRHTVTRDPFCRYCGKNYQP